LRHLTGEQPSVCHQANGPYYLKLLNSPNAVIDDGPLDRSVSSVDFSKWDSSLVDRSMAVEYSPKICPARGTINIKEAAASVSTYHPPGVAVTLKRPLPRAQGYCSGSTYAIIQAQRFIQIRRSLRQLLRLIGLKPNQSD